MLMQKLRLRQTQDNDCVAIINELKRLKLINDVAYAQSLIRSEANYRHASTQRIRQKLRHKGIPNSIIEAELKENQEETESEEDRIRYHVARYLRQHPEPDRQKFAGYLYRKGFSGSVISQAIRDALHNFDNSI